MPFISGGRDLWDDVDSSSWYREFPEGLRATVSESVSATMVHHILSLGQFALVPVLTGPWERN